MNIWNDIQCRSLVVPPIPKIAMGICLIHNTNISELRGKRRTMDLVNVRQKVAREASENGYTSEQIGDYLNRDHSTILHYLNKRQPQIH